jgi:hypothetical protein
VSCDSVYLVHCEAHLLHMKYVTNLITIYSHKLVVFISCKTSSVLKDTQKQSRNLNKFYDLRHVQRFLDLQPFHEKMYKREFGFRLQRTGSISPKLCSLDYIYQGVRVTNFI